MMGNWRQANLWVARFLCSLEIGISSSANPYVDEFIETMDCGLMTTAKMLDTIKAARARLGVCRDGGAELPTFLFLLLCGDAKNDTFLKLTTGKTAEQWQAAFLKSNAECGVCF